MTQGNSDTIEYYCKFSDERGRFEGIINEGFWQEINIVHTHAGCTRGGHYHRHTIEVIFLLTGKANVELCSVDNPSTTVRISLMAGEGIQIPTMTAHQFTYLENSTHLQLLTHRFDPDNQDLFNVSMATT